MPMDASSRWEHGSEFHWLPYEKGSTDSPPWSTGAALLGSGRHALVALLLQGRNLRGWGRIWIPGYFCQEVVRAILTTGIRIAVYADGPSYLAQSLDHAQLRPGDVVLRVNYFGLRERPAADVADCRGVEVIEDHTHDPWSRWAQSSEADWCIASLRKTLPVPDGGVVWSPRGHPLPGAAHPSREHEAAASRKLTAMLLKALYLRGHAVEKERYRELAIAGEADIASDPVCSMAPSTAALLNTFPIGRWRRRRRANYRTLAEALGGVSWLDVDPLPANAGVSPFSVVLSCDSPGRRSFLRERLVRSGVYPAILWDLEHPVVPGASREATDFSRRMLSIHCDMRYAAGDMLEVARRVREFGDEYPEG